MVRSRRLAAALGLLAVLALGSGSVAADSNGHGGKILDTTLAGIPVAGQVLLGVPGGGRPWTLVRGDAKLWADGSIDLKVHGLLLGPGGTNEGTNPVTLGRAIVVCNGVDKVLSETVPFDADGDARVKTTLTLPSPCLAPVIFFGSAGGSWFAVSG
jgi:hypothetical protein